MRGKRTLFLDQNGSSFVASTTKELREMCGGGRVHKMYVDRGGKSLHVGYVVGKRWLTAYQRVERPA